MANILLPNIDSVVKGSTGKREKVAVDTLGGEGKVIGLYFSAHWCPPCRGFTPKLAEWYNELKKGDLRDKFEIVFVSSDRDEDAFNEYFDEMPWLGLPYDQRELKQKLSSKYKVSGIPTFLIFDAKTGELINKNGRALVSEDPKGLKFPWREPTLKETLSSVKFVNAQGEEKSFSEMEGKPLAIYFSAHWCPPCRMFTPTLATFYNSHAKNKFELIFVSGDRTEADFKEYLKEMPWYAIPFANDELRAKLNEEFEVEGIPHLVILDENLKVTTDVGRAMVERDSSAKDFPWGPKALDSLHSGTAHYINVRPCMVYASGSSDVGEGISKMKAVAEEYFEKNKDKEDSIIFLYTDGDALDDKLLKFLNITEPFPKLFMIDIPNGKKYINEDSTIDVKKFLTDFQDGKVASKGLRE